MSTLLSEPPAVSTRDQHLARQAQAHAMVALAGNPNAGKTCVFNALSGLRAHTANFAGTTVDYRLGRLNLPQRRCTLVDLPGLYTLDAHTPDERVAESVLRGGLPGRGLVDAVILVLDATHLERGLFLARQVVELGRPTVVALNMMDLASRHGLRINPQRLALELGCEVIPVSARTGQGLGTLREAVQRLLQHRPLPVLSTSAMACGSGCNGCPYRAGYEWAEQVAQCCGGRRTCPPSAQVEWIDRVLTHPVAGVAAFLAALLALFYLVFETASYPMDLIEAVVAWLGTELGALLGEGDLSSLVADGIIGGVGGVLVFLPQIAILFFFITLLEDSGYLARAAFVMDRLMRRVGLPGKAFVPMLSAHACAVPAIMSARIIDDWRDRLAAILVLPLLSCSARLPVYSMIVMLLFRDRPLVAAAAFTGAYVLGIVAALGAAALLRRTILPGRASPLLIELPDYRRPSLRSALLTTWDRSFTFVRRAGTVILLLSVVLWAMATYPKLPEGAAGEAVVAALVEGEEQAGADEAGRALEYSFAGRVGKAFEPVFAPLGFDWRINVGVISSFAAREMIISTLAVVYSVEGEDEDEQMGTLAGALETARRPDGTLVFTTATALSLLVFYILAMQCVPTSVITWRETRHWKWPLLQWLFMTGLAYLAALLVYQVASRIV